MVYILFVFSFLLVIVVGAVLLQVFLSKQENKWLGLILPIITFGLSVIVSLSAFLFTSTKAVVSSNGQVISESTTNSVGSVFLLSVILLILWNIPNVVFLPIYIGVRSKYSKNKNVGKMNIQDL